MKRQEQIYIPVSSLFLYVVVPKHLEFRQKYSAACRTLNSLLGFSISRCNTVSHITWRTFVHVGRVVRKPVNTNPGLKVKGGNIFSSIKMFSIAYVCVV